MRAVNPASAWPRGPGARWSTTAARRQEPAIGAGLTASPRFATLI